MAAVSGTSGASGDYLKMVWANQAKEQEIRRMYGFTDKDHVSIYTLPKGQIGKKYGGGSYKPMSMKATRLQQSIYALRGRMVKVEHGDLDPTKKAARLEEMRGELKALGGKLNSEIAATPRVGVIVLEEEV